MNPQVLSPQPDLSAGPYHPRTRSAKHRSSLRKIAILGSPNVGKSLLFNRLTSRYVTVSNYPGTTVEISRGQMRLGSEEFEVMDTPGIYSLSPLTEEERVARDILYEEELFLALHVIDAKNLERMLPLTLELLRASCPVILILNMMDEAAARGIEINDELLGEELGIPVVKTVLVTGKGMKDLEKVIERVARHCEEAKGRRSNLVGLSNETGLLRRYAPRNDAEQILESALKLRREAHQISEKVFHETQRLLGKKKNGPKVLSNLLDWLTMNPLTGIPILLGVLYWGVYQFVGVFGGGTVVDFLETTIFEEHINPFLRDWFGRWMPWAVIRDLFVGEYGMLTLGVRYAVALILPIVSFYFLVFAIIEDTGYLPRLAMLVDRVFKKIGLSGRAVIPMVLGFGCDTMATVVTRTLPTIRERVISTLLLSLAIPCSAQMGVILAILTGHPLAMGLWVGVLIFVFLVIGFLTAQLLPGQKPSFYMELPPLRWPKISNVFTKTYVRVKWYFVEVMPLFVLASALIWLGQLTGVFDWIIRVLSAPVRWMGLPAEAAKIFLFGFFRRDYGAAGLYDLVHAGLLNGIQITVAAVALTLFLPCIAQFLMNVKERGWKTGLAISAFILFFSFGLAAFLNWILVRLGAQL